MPNWKKPVRNIFRMFRRRHIVPDIEVGLRWGRYSELGRYSAVILDIIPGLGHVFQGCFKKVWWLVLLWWVFIASGIYFFPSSLGFALLGIGIGIHIWIITRHSLWKDIENFKSKAFAVIGLYLFLLFVYRYSPRIFLPVTGGYTTLTIPWNNVEPSDYFLARRNIRLDMLERGSLVLIEPRAIGRRNTTTVIGQVAALPGELIAIEGNSFVINGQVMDNSRYPVPRWLHRIKMSLNMDSDSYFISLEYRPYGMPNDEYIRQTCIYKFEDMRARAFMRWSPISKRGVIE